MMHHEPHQGIDGIAVLNGIDVCHEGNTDASRSVEYQHADDRGE